MKPVYPNNVVFGSSGKSNSSSASAGGGGVSYGSGGSGNYLQSGGQSLAPSWVAVNNLGLDSDIPIVTLEKFLTRDINQHSLKKIESKKWKVINLTFKEIILLQDQGIKYIWCQDNKTVYITFETEADESQAIMLIGSIPYGTD